MIRKVISGGQTGVDRAGLDAAFDSGIPIGGYCPKGKRAEDGTIPNKYPLTELDSPESYYRTEKNVLESDGTLIVNKGEINQGTKLTKEFTVNYGKPCLVIQLDELPVTPISDIIRWINGQYISTLNVAGPRESKISGGIYKETYNLLEKLFTTMKEMP